MIVADVKKFVRDFPSFHRDSISVLQVVVLSSYTEIVSTYSSVYTNSPFSFKQLESGNVPAADTVKGVPLDELKKLQDENIQLRKENASLKVRPVIIVLWYSSSSYY